MNRIEDKIKQHIEFSNRLNELAEKYAENPSKSGEIRQLSDEELENFTPSHDSSF